jgi:hypothetical protein
LATIAQELEKLKFEVSKGRGGERIHVTWVERDQADRIKNNNRVTRFSLETKDPDLCAELHREWERVIKRVGNKSIALSLIHQAWRDALSDKVLDQILAQMEGAPE